jgi:lysophospholipase L1-like esterase
MACADLGFELDNYAISMSTLAYNTDGTDTHNALVGRYNSMSNDADLVWIAIGTNDWYNVTVMSLGTFDDRVNTTFYGALHILCAGLKAKYGAIPIIFATPIKRWLSDRVDPTPPKNMNAHNEPITLYCNAIKEVCEYYGIPVVDMYAMSYLNSWLDYDRTNWVPDGTHPNGAGHKRMQIECEAVLRKYLPIVK